MSSTFSVFESAWNQLDPDMRDAVCRNLDFIEAFQSDDWPACARLALALRDAWVLASN